MNNIKTFVSHAFSLGSGQPAANPAVLPPAPTPPAAPNIIVNPPTPQAPAPMPDPYGAAVREARRTAMAKSLGGFGRSSTILTTAQNRGGPRPLAGGAGSAGAYTKSTLGGG